MAPNARECGGAHDAQPFDRAIFFKRLLEIFGNAKVGDVHDIALSTSAHEEVIGLYVSVHYPLRVHILQALNELIAEHQHRFQRKAAFAEVEEIIKIRPEVFEDDCIFRIGENQSCNAGTALELLVEYHLLLHRGWPAILK